MKFRFWFAVAVTLQLGGVGRAPAQSGPDIVWQTNAHAGSIFSVAFSAGGHMLASGSQDRTAKVWAVPGGVLVRTVNTPNEWVLSVALSPDGKFLATGGDDGGTRMWHVADGVRLWQTGPSENLIQSTVFAPDGLLLADASHDGDIVVHDPLTGRGLPFYGHAEAVTVVAFLPDGTRLASSSLDGTARIWRVSDRTTLYVLTGHSILSTNEDDIVINPVWDVDVAPDGALLATTGADNTVRLWSTANGTQVRVINSTNCGVVKFSADGKLLFTVNNGPINIWRVDTGQLLHSYTGANAGPLAVASNGKFFAYGRGDGSVVLARVPLWIESITEAAGKVTLRWQGGSGRYQVQRRKGLSDGPWRAVGRPTTNTSATVKATVRKFWFYRVQSLPVP